MSEPAATIYPRADGGIDLVGVAEGLAGLLLALPGTIAADAPPEVQARLFPDISEDDEQANAEWKQLVRPELFHLLASAREGIESDLRGLALTSAGDTRGRLEIPGKHRDAWISGLQAARLALGARHGLDVYQPEPPDNDDERRRMAIAQVTMAVYADLQWQLVEGVMEEFPDDDETWSSGNG